MKNKYYSLIKMLAALFVVAVFTQNCGPTFRPVSLLEGRQIASLGDVGPNTVAKTLSWEAPLDENGRPDTSVTGYNVYLSTKIGEYEIPKFVSLKNNIVLNLEKGNTYYIAVAAVNGLGEGEKS